MIRLLVVDDSPLMRKLLTRIFTAAGDFEIEVARDGAEALVRLSEFRPDVVTLDIHMPGMDGLACLNRLMIERPCPVVMFSSLTADGAAETVEALALGAVDFVLKPQGAISLEIETLAPHLVETVRMASKARLRPAHRLTERIRLRNLGIERNGSEVLPRQRAAIRKRANSEARTVEMGVVLIGASTGGPPALDAILSKIPGDFPWPIVVAQHMPAQFTSALARRLDKLCELTVSHVSGLAELEPGNVYIARGDADIVISSRANRPVVVPAPASGEYRWHPSVDRMVIAAMEHLEPERLVGILVTGMGNDGATAMTRLRAAGGHTIAEAEETAIVWGMPGELVKAGGAQWIEPLPQISQRLLQILGRR